LICPGAVWRRTLIYRLFHFLPGRIEQIQAPQSPIELRWTYVVVLDLACQFLAAGFLIKPVPELALPCTISEVSRLLSKLQIAVTRHWNNGQWGCSTGHIAQASDVGHRDAHQMFRYAKHAVFPAVRSRVFTSSTEPARLRRHCPSGYAVARVEIFDNCCESAYLRMGTSWDNELAFSE
jgi:hypothetical protein